jgi:Arc/MetJ-type ribon-helix-helix transcriptional regulator
MATHIVELTPEAERILAAQLESGGYASLDEIVNQGLAVLEEQEELNQDKLFRLQYLIAQSAKSYAEGHYTAINSEEELQSFMDSAMEEAQARLRYVGVRQRGSQ